MKASTNQIIVIVSIILAIFLLYYLSPILTPFLLGALLAYLVDPLVKKLQRSGVPHLLSVVIIFLLLFSTIIVFVLLLYPLVYNQIVLLVNLLPAAVEWIQSVGMPWILQFININTIKSSLPATLSKTGWVVSTFIQSSMVAIQIIYSIILTPIVTFYLLRDWDKVTQGIKSLLPKQSAPTIIQLAGECDEVLGAFIRGQLIVMVCLSFIYGIGLTLVGLKLGLIIGLVGGMLSIVPYLGSLFVVIVGVMTALGQVGTWHAVVAVFIVFLIGQAIEGYILTPYLIGERIGLHPVAVIFAIMAGGTLFGFFGILLALPIAAILMATFRFFRRKRNKLNHPHPHPSAQRG